MNDPTFSACQAREYVAIFTNRRGLYRPSYDETALAHAIPNYPIKVFYTKLPILFNFKVDCMDLASQFLLVSGFSSKQVHEMKHREKLKSIFSAFSLNVPVDYMPNKKMAKLGLQKIFKGVPQNPTKYHVRMNILAMMATEEIEVEYDDGDIFFARRKNFYSSSKWRELRIIALANSNGCCEACGRSPGEHGVVLHVDHVYPRSIYPHLALQITNLQVLCEDCNMGKGNAHTFDFRNM